MLRLSLAGMDTDSEREGGGHGRTSRQRDHRGGREDGPAGQERIEVNISVKQSSGLFSRIGGAVQPKGPQAPVLLNECPEVIGKMAVDISGGGSIEHAIRQI